jgi:DNA repair photolyase
MNPARIFITPEAKPFPMTARVLAAFPEAERINVPDPTKLPLPTEMKRRFVYAKRSLLLDVHRGPLVRTIGRPYGESKPEAYLYSSVGCRCDCQYCFLQEWAAHPTPTLFVNNEDLLDQIGRAVAEHNGQLYLHAGEVAEPLWLDRVTGLSKTLVEACRAFPGLTCEVRTKDDELGSLLDMGSAPSNLILSWTLSPEPIRRRYEPGTATTEARIFAMQKAARAGYAIALRLDPAICEGNFEAAYSELLQSVAEALPEPPVSINAGSMRISVQGLAIARRRFPRSLLFAGELVRSQDGRYRYARPLRKRAYDAIAETAKRLWNLDVQLCMEVTS